MPGITSVPITKQVDDTFKSSHNIYQRLRILIRALLRHQIYVIDHQGKEQYDEFIYGIKRAVFENTLEK
jgi:hypothetical protein